MIIDSLFSGELFHARYPELKELWMLVYESDSLYHRLKKLKKFPLNKFPIIARKIDRVIERNIKRYQRRISCYHTTKKLIVDPNEKLYGGGQAI